MSLEAVSAVSAVGDDEPEDTTRTSPERLSGALRRNRPSLATVLELSVLQSPELPAGAN